MVFVVELSAAQVWFHYSFPMCHTSDFNSWRVSLAQFSPSFERCAAVPEVVVARMKYVGRACTYNVSFVTLTMVTGFVSTSATCSRSMHSKTPKYAVHVREMRRVRSGERGM